MGLNFITSSHHGDRSWGCAHQEARGLANNQIRALPLPPNPDPHKFTIERVKRTGDYMSLLVHYPGCTNYEGRKILVLAGITEPQLRAMQVLDPHFLEDGPVIARFRPDEHGWELALRLMHLLLN